MKIRPANRSVRRQGRTIRPDRWKRLKSTSGADGINPVAEKRQRKLESTTLAQMLEDYIDTHQLAPSTVTSYRTKAARYLAPLMDKPVSQISKETVINLQAAITKSAGATSANIAKRILRLVLRFAMHKGAVASAATEVLTTGKLWHKSTRRTRKITKSDLPNWYQAVLRLDNPMVRIYLLLLLHTGMRTGETGVTDGDDRKPLHWRDVDLEKRTIHLPDPKNHNPITLPIPECLIPHLRELHAITGDKPYLFHSPASKTGVLSWPKWQINKVIAESGCKFSPHDLRRTYLSIRAALNINQVVVKKLANHVTSHDVTGGYIVTELETLREATEKISAYILSVVGETGDNVIAFPAREAG
jgi:integrase